MTDKELLEMAAKAAGYEVNLLREEPEGWYRWDTPHKMVWNPLTDDGDALRLAVKLSIDIEHQCPGVEAYRSYNHDSYEGGGTYCAGEGDDGSDPYAATRRAIVRAAAEIGKAMP